LKLLDDGIGAALRDAGCNVLEMKKGGLFDVAHQILDLALPFADVSPLELGRALVAFGTLQEAAASPYPPTNGVFIDCDTPDNNRLINRLSRAYRMCLAAYPPGAMQICGLSLQARSQEEFFEMLTGLPREAILREVPTAETPPTQTHMAGAASNPELAEPHTHIHTTDEVPVSPQQHAPAALPKPSPSAPAITRPIQKDVSLSSWVSSAYRPIYFTTVDHDTEEIALTFRGTLSVSDCLTDLCCQIEEGQHSGMVTSAQWFDTHLREPFTRLANMYPNYKIILQGHSMGGGVASLLALKWIEDPTLSPRLHCFSFGAPCIVTAELALACKRVITSVVFARDAVSRASVGSIHNMRKVLLHLAKGTETEGRRDRPGRHVRRSPHQSSSSSHSTSGDFPPPSHIDTDSLRHTADDHHDTVLADEPIVQPDSQRRGFPPDEVTSGIGRLPASYPLSTLTTTQVLKLVAAKKNLSPLVDRETKMFWDRQLKMALTALRSLYDDQSNVLCPAGRTILLLPPRHLARVGLPTPEGLTQGLCAAMEMGGNVLDLASEIIFHRGAFPDHNPVNVAQAFALC